MVRGLVVVVVVVVGVNLCWHKYLQDEAVRLNVCLSIGKARKSINVLAMTVTLKQIFTCLKNQGTDP